MVNEEYYNRFIADVRVEFNRLVADHIDQLKNRLLPPSSTPQTVFEAIHSPDFTRHCIKNHYRFADGVSVARGTVRYAEPMNDGTWMHVIVKHNPLFDGGEIQQPYRITSADGTYKDPRDERAKWWKDGLESGDIKFYMLDLSDYDGESNIKKYEPGT